MSSLAILSLVMLSLLSSPSLHSTASMDSTPWPVFHQNAQHTGLSPLPGPTVPFLKWKFQTGGAIYSSPTVGHGRIYLTSYDGNVYALNQQGVLLWTFQTGWPLMSTPAIGSDGTIYVAGCNQCGNPNIYGFPQGVLYAFSPSGQLKWNLTLPNAGEGVDVLSSPTLGPDETIYTSNNDFQILAVHPNGTIKWQVGTFGEVRDSPALASDGTVYVGVDDPGPSGACGQCLMAINPDGTVRWGVLPHAVGFSSPAVGSDGTVYINGFAVNPDGSVKWEAPGAFSSPSIGPGGTIYGSGDAVNPDGTLRWTFPAGTTDVAIGSDGTVYFGSGANSLYALGPNGTLDWKFELGSTGCLGPYCILSVSDPAIGPGGTIYVGSTDGNLYSVG